MIALKDGILTLEGGPCTFSTHERFLVAKSGLPFRLFGKLELLRLRGWQIFFVRLSRLRPLQEVQLKIGGELNLSLELLLAHIEVLAESLK